MRTSKQTKEDRHTTHEMQRNKKGQGRAKPGAHLERCDRRAERLLAKYRGTQPY